MVETRHGYAHMMYDVIIQIKCVERSLTFGNMSADPACCELIVAHAIADRSGPTCLVAFSFLPVDPFRGWEVFTVSPFA